MSATQQNRFCPACGSDRDEAFCPADGTATVRRTKVDVDALNYPAGHVVVGRYRITGRLGRGGFGAVFSAVHTGTGQTVALKLLHVELGASNAVIVRRFWKEAQITAQLRHANTVRVFDVGQTEEGAFYIAMEQLHGATLADVLDDLAGRGEVMPPDQVARIGIEICKSLAEAHKAGLVHRDLKPGNVMLLDHDDGEVPVKVLDFGIAHASDSSLTGQGSTLGTPAYMSPEQCRGGGVDARSDVYSLGVLLFRCLTGQQPYADPNPLALMYQHIEAPIPDVRTVAPQPLSDGWAAALRRAMAKQPSDRFADTKEFRQALEWCARPQAASGAGQSGLTGSLPPALAREPVAAVPKRALHLPLLAAGIAVATVVALAWLLATESTQPAIPASQSPSAPVAAPAPAPVVAVPPAPPPAPAPPAPTSAPTPGLAPSAAESAGPAAAAQAAPGEPSAARPTKPAAEAAPPAAPERPTVQAGPEKAQEKPAGNRTEKPADLPPPKPPIVTVPGDPPAEKPTEKPKPKLEKPTALD
ncbi:MAG: serine/threonine protein kinase [Deltaproteobacteria bacterium]|nr:serine/threonine protein kinase [Deltaproteobacteria bacterium]